jgi:hypothetical protein
MIANDLKEKHTDTLLGTARSGNRLVVSPGLINCGSRLDPYHSLSARLRAEIDGRISAVRNEIYSK